MTEVSFAKSFLSTLDSKTAKYKQDHIFQASEIGTRIPFVLPKLPHPQHPNPPRPHNDLSATPQPGSEPATATTNTINITLKSTRNPVMTLTLPLTPPSTTVTSLKEQIQTYLGGPNIVASVDKIKILFNKKPVPASKQTIGEVVGIDTTTKDLELGVMVMGGAPDPPPQNTPTAAVEERGPEPAGPDSENAAVEAETGVNPAQSVGGTVAMEGVESTSAKPRSESQPRPVQPGEDSGEAVLEAAEFWSDLEGFLAQRIRNSEDATRLRATFEKAWRSARAAP